MKNIIPVNKISKLALDKILEYFMKRNILENDIITERPFTNLKHGFSGTPDLYSPVYLFDIKTTDLNKFRKYKKPFESHGMQIAAYRTGLKKNQKCVEIYIDRYNGDIEFYEWSEKEIDKYWKMFYHCLEIWFLDNDYNPRILEDSIIP